METALNKNSFFCAGSMKDSLTGDSKGILAAVSFDRDLKLLNQTVLDDYDLQACTSLRRFPQNDDLFVGSFLHLLIVTWTGRDFIVNRFIENVHTGKKIDNFV